MDRISYSFNLLDKDNNLLCIDIDYWFKLFINVHFTNQIHSLSTGLFQINNHAIFIESIESKVCNNGYGTILMNSLLGFQQIYFPNIKVIAGNITLFDRTNWNKSIPFYYNFYKKNKSRFTDFILYNLSTNPPNALNSNNGIDTNDILSHIDNYPSGFKFKYVLSSS